MARDRYSYVTAGARDAEGNYTGKYRRSKGDIARGALVGFLQGLGGGGGLGAGLGGALAGGAVPLVNPKAGREMLFDTTVAPRLMRDQAEAQRQQAMVRQAQEQAMNDRYKLAQIGSMESENAYRIGQLGVAQENAKRQAAIAQSQIEYNNARAEAARTGKLVIRDIVDEDGQVRTYQIAPDGSLSPLGGSATAAINQANIKSRENIAKQREAGANARATTRQANKPKKGYVSMDRIRQYMRDTGKSKSEAIADALNDGYRIAGRQ
jgi:hypothetical protein